MDSIGLINNLIWLGIAALYVHGMYDLVHASLADQVEFGGASAMCLVGSIFAAILMLRWRVEQR